MCSLSLPWSLFPPDSGSSPSPDMASPAWLFDWLVCIPRWSHHAVRLAVCKKWLRRFLFFFTHYILPLRSKPSQLTQHCFHLPVKACCRNECDNLTRALSVARTSCVIILNYSDKTKPSPSRSEERTARDLTIQVFTNSTLLIWTSHHTDIAVSWMMEKSVWNIVCDSLGCRSKHNKTVFEDKLGKGDEFFFFNYVKCLVKAFDQQARRLCHTANGDRLLWCPYWLYAHQNEMAWDWENKAYYPLQQRALPPHSGTYGQQAQMFWTGGGTSNSKTVFILLICLEDFN